MLILYSVTLLNLLILGQYFLSVCMWTTRLFSHIIIMSSRNNLFLPFPCICSLITFKKLIRLASTFHIILNESGKNGNPFALFLIWGGNNSIFSINYVNCEIFAFVFYFDRCSLSSERSPYLVPFFYILFFYPEWVVKFFCIETYHHATYNFSSLGY